MIFPKSKYAKIAQIMLVIILCACEKRIEKKPLTGIECNNFRIQIAWLFPKETVNLYVNDTVVLNYKVDSIDGYMFRRNFCLDSSRQLKIRLKTTYKGKTYIDTLFSVCINDQTFKLSTTMPYPKDLENYLVPDSFPPFRQWGPLAIDSCLRSARLLPDTFSYERHESDPNYKIPIY